MNLVKNDLVKVISGKYKTKTGKVLKVYPDKNRVIIEGVGMIKRHTKPSRKHPQGGIVEKEAPIHVSNLMVFCKIC
jgi:large subunit ribosomal protein L24